MALTLKNSTALVTGGGSGICLALTKKLLAAGCNVLVADVALTPEAQEIVNQNNGDARCAFVETDVTDWAQLRRAFEEAMKEFGRLDLVVPGAGVFEPTYSNFWEFDTSTTLDTDAASSFKILDINIYHPIRATQLAIDFFRRQKVRRGVVCHIASVASQVTLLPVPLYCTSKHAIAAFVRSMAALEESGIRVNAVAPGIVKTPIWSEKQLGWIDEENDSWVAVERVADVMIDLITQEENVGGTILEVGSETVRAVEMLNDPGPQSKGQSLGKLADAFVDAHELLEKNFGK